MQKKICDLLISLQISGGKMTYKRIVSLTPSITETLFAMSVKDRVVGVTDACDYPPEANSKSHVCSWFDPDLDRVTALEPDLVLGLTATHKQLALFLNKKGIKCTLFNPATVDEALADMQSLAALLSISEQVASLVKGLKQRLEKLAKQVDQIKPEAKQTVSRVLDYEDEQLIVAGPKSFQFDVIKQAGGINVSTAINEAYPVISFQTFKTWDPDMIFLCGTDQSYISRLQADPKWQSLTAIRNGNLHLFDCGLTCRTGPRIVDMAELLFQTLYA
jgi:iron complex transport system substrate-binding protein